MPNQFQLVFLASFVGVFALLLLVSNFVKAKLAEAGYDISQLILIGLPKDDNDAFHTSPSAFLTTRNSMLAQLLAVVLALGTSIVIYLKFGSSRLFISRTRPVVDPVAERKPVLDPKQWQEFPLKEKIVISPNTAL